MLLNYIMAIEYPSHNKMQEYITSTFEYANKYYNEIKRVYDSICSSENESDIRNTIIEIGKEIYNSGGEKAISGCIVIMILTNNIKLYIYKYKNNKIIFLIYLNNKYISLINNNNNNNNYILMINNNILYIIKIYKIL